MLTKITVFLQFDNSTVQTTAMQGSGKTHVKMPCGASRLLRDNNHVIYQGEKVEVQNAH